VPSVAEYVSKNGSTGFAGEQTAVGCTNKKGPMQCPAQILAKPGFHQAVAVSNLLQKCAISNSRPLLFPAANASLAASIAAMKKQFGALMKLKCTQKIRSSL
jgi:hypothetical protein